MSDIKQLISIIVPVFNESESIGLLLDEVINVMSSHKFNFELIVVNAVSYTHLTLPTNSRV